jgi:hypothetical protein
VIEARFPAILPSARRHQEEQGIKDEDIWHAWENAVATVLGSDGMALLLGQDSRDRWLEIGQQLYGEYPTPIVHAMLARPRYLTTLRKQR